jgi:hypothetical protein
MRKVGLSKSGITPLHKNVVSISPVVAAKKSIEAKKKEIAPIKPPNSENTKISNTSPIDGEGKYYKVLYGKYKPNKKHKEFPHDGWKQRNHVKD